MDLNKLSSQCKRIQIECQPSFHESKCSVRVCVCVCVYVCVCVCLCVCVYIYIRMCVGYGACGWMGVFLDEL